MLPALKIDSHRTSVFRIELEPRDGSCSCELLLLTAFNSQSKMQSLRSNEDNEIVHTVVYIYNKLVYCQNYFIVR
jgi:hypothetical protein